MSVKTMKLPKLYRHLEASDALITRAGEDEAGRKLYELSFSSEFPYDRYFGTEILGHSKGEADLQRLNKGAGVFVDQHGAWGGVRVGRVMKAWLDEEKKRCRAIIRFSRTTVGQDAEREVEDGDLVGCSAGYKIRSMDLVSADSKKGNTYRCKWEAWEITLTGLAVDPTVGVGRSDDRNETYDVEVTEAEASTEETEMRGRTLGPTQGRLEEAPERAAGGAATSTVEVQGRGEGKELGYFEREGEKIIKLGRSHNMPEKIPGWLEKRATAAQVNDEIMEAYRTGSVKQPSAESIVDAPLKDRKRYSYRKALELAVRQVDPKQGKTDDFSLESDYSREIEKKLPSGIERHAGGVFMPTRVFDVDPEQAELSRMAAAREFYASGGHDVLGRAMGSMVTGGGAEIVQPQVREIIDLLRVRTGLARSGATFLTGLTQPIQWPVDAGDPTSYWMDENPASDVAFSDATLLTNTSTPKSLSAAMLIPRQLPLLASIDVEAWLRKKLGAVDARAIDRAGFHGLGTDKQPLGIYNTPLVQSFPMGGAPTYAKLVDMLTLLPDKNVESENLRLCFTALQAGRLLRTPVLPDTASGFVWQGSLAEGNVAGYGATYSGSLRKDLGGGSNEHAIVAGDFSNVVVGQWGAFEIVANPFTYLKKGQVEYVTHNMADITLLQRVAMVIATGATLAA